FFQAEDGIRDRNVTGVQTCALPIFVPHTSQIRLPVKRFISSSSGTWMLITASTSRPKLLNISFNASACSTVRGKPSSKNPFFARSEERRVGKECRAEWSRYYLKNIG